MEIVCNYQFLVNKTKTVLLWNKTKIHLLFQLNHFAAEHSFHFERWIQVFVLNRKQCFGWQQVRIAGSRLIFWKRRILIINRVMMNGFEGASKIIDLRKNSNENKWSIIITVIDKEITCVNPIFVGLFKKK